MRLLICTQAVDEHDPALGFFVRWIEEFAKHCESVEVICVRAGKYSLPNNVRVHSAGKESGAPRMLRWWRILRYVTGLRRDYDAVFVHMNTEYVLLGGILWRLWGKRVALWYAHGSTSIKLRLAVALSTTVCTSTEGGLRIKSSKRHILSQGIDTDFFKPDPNVARGTEILSVGRLAKTKRHDLIIRAMQFAHRDLWIAGDGPEKNNLEALARELGVASRVHFLGPRTQDELRALYRRAGVFAHTSETGSLDKVVLEALACGCPVITTRTNLGDVPATIVSPTPEALAAAIESPLPSGNAAYVQKCHSLSLLVDAIIARV